MSTKLLLPIENTDLPSTEAPAGKLWVCLKCGTRVKEGQTHTSARPVPHQSLLPILGVK